MRERSSLRARHSFLQMRRLAIAPTALRDSTSLLLRRNSNFLTFTTATIYRMLTKHLLIVLSLFATIALAQTRDHNGSPLNPRAIAEVHRILNAEHPIQLNPSAPPYDKIHRPLTTSPVLSPRTTRLRAYRHRGTAHSECKGDPQS